jgi:hypothetical protein
MARDLIISAVANLQLDAIEKFLKEGHDGKHARGLAVLNSVRKITQNNQMAYEVMVAFAITPESYNKLRKQGVEKTYKEYVESMKRTLKFASVVSMMKTKKLLVSYLATMDLSQYEPKILRQSLLDEIELGSSSRKRQRTQ